MHFLASWLENLSIRQRIVLLLAQVLLPVAAFLGWMLVADARREQDVAQEKVRILATGTAADLQRVLDQSRAALEQLSARPLVKALDPQRCDPLVGEYLAAGAATLGYAVRDARGNIVCRYEVGSQPVRTLSDASWARPASPDGAFGASNLLVDERTGLKFAALSVPIRDESGAQTGLLIMAVDLLELSQQLLASTPGDAVVTVLDRTRTLLLRSTRAQEFVGARLPGADVDPARGARQGHFSLTGVDGVPRLVAFETLPGVDWRVAASLPEAQVLADYNAALRRIVGVALALCLFAFALAWRLSAAIARPIAQLRETAAEIAAGKQGVRAKVSGPAEVESVAREMNRILDARALSEARLRGIFESAVDAILTTDEHQVIVHANPAAARMLRCTMDALIGAPLDRFIPARFRESHRRDVAAFGGDPVTARPMALQRDVSALRADGVEFPIEAAISRASVAGGVLYTVILRDVSERRQTEQALRTGASKLKAALSSMSDAVFITDAQGRFIEFNDAFVTFNRFADRAACKTTLSEYAATLDGFTPDGHPLPQEQWPAARALRGETATGVEYRLRRKDSGETWIGSFSFAPIKSKEGAIVGAVVTGRDVSAIRQVQADLESSHVALQQLIASKDHVQEEERRRIARELHDDLQQTLAAIRMDLRAIGDRFGARAPDLRALLQGADSLAEQAVVSTRRVVNDLRPPMLDDLGLLPSLELLVAQFIQKHRVACAIDAPEEVSDELAPTPAIALCLYRIAQEALNNIAKHSDASQANIRLALEPGPSVSLRVSDDGRGMDPDARREPQSFGILGMRERVRAHDGILNIRSTPEGGTVLEVLIPLANALGEAPPGDDKPDHALVHDALDEAHALPRLLSHASHRALQDVIDALAGNVAIVDQHGVIRFVNRAWTDFAERNGNPGAALVGPGVNYLEVCRRSAGADKSALHVVEGLEDVARRRRTVFTCEYPCHAPNEMRWFQMHATPMATGDVMVAHFLVSRESHPHVVFDAGRTVQAAFTGAS
ncbi:PAS domain S-box protein [Variovorax sp. J22R133]|uniref:PAS domain S-box protein n=1 Tax=Variovorax brevis TaxID=3053503 RepID=UPI0025777F44|nr:PAS domain S-box protein [Variovorax sp. J22R133]MDM0110805.1 PAS domain S-box protein [Variovorax sp. J22R133]